MIHFNPYLSVSQKRLQQLKYNLELRIILLPLTVGCLLGAFTLFPSYEILTESKSLQLMTDLSGAVYWFSNYVFDGLVYTITWAVLMVMYSLFYKIGTEASGKSVTSLY